MAVLVVESRLTPGLELSLPCLVEEAFVLVAKGAYALRVRLEVLEVACDSRLGQELAHGQEVPVRVHGLPIGGCIDSFDGLHCSLLASTG
jgi:hypothetical protein